MSHTTTRRIRRIGLGLILFILLATIANGLYASHLLWSNYDRLVSALENGRTPFPDEQVSLEITREEAGRDAKREGGRIEQISDGQRLRLEVEIDDHQLGIDAGDMIRVWMPNGEGDFAAESNGVPELRKSAGEAATVLKRFGGGLRRIVASLAIHPLISGWGGDSDAHWQVRFRGGHAVLDAEGWVRQLRFNDPSGQSAWHARLSRAPLAGPLSEIEFHERSPKPVPADELDRSLAEILRLLVLQIQPIIPPPDGAWREGKGWLEVKDGHRLLHLEGSPYEIGFQHGRLLGGSARRLLNHTLFGVGFIYSMEKGAWFPEEARKLVERQRPFIHDHYFEEMRGLADGARLPLQEVQAVNLFPEFFHCSGAALFGRATKGGMLLHARVLDYMTKIGLQDEAVVAAIHRDDALAFVNVGYAGFIGSVTGMNERQVAIGEMGGRGEGAWDGTPMSLLLRGALEETSTLEEAVGYMRDRPRTCEYYYVISDGKGPDAVGIAATPDTFQVVRSGTTCEQLPEQVDDAVLLSSGDRYEKLVERVREHHGEIDTERLFEIVKRPVAMKSNLHNVIFEPQALRLWVANATRTGLACDQDPVVYTWAELFP